MNALVQSLRVEVRHTLQDVVTTAELSEKVEEELEKELLRRATHALGELLHGWTGSRGVRVAKALHATTVLNAHLIDVMKSEEASTRLLEEASA